MLAFMNKIRLLFILLLPLSLLAQDSKIPWTQSVKLTWSDFEAPVDASSEFYAWTQYYFNYNYKWDGEGKVTVNVKTSFVKNQSWRNTSKSLSPVLLKHEQGHFDLAEVYGRKMRKAYTAYCFSHKHTANTKTEIDDIFNKLLDETHVAQAQYDQQTGHSRAIGQQEEWNTKIAAMLAGLSEYAER